MFLAFFIMTLSRYDFPPSMVLTSTGNRDAKPASFHLDRDDIKNDLTSQRPIYPLSCYGPGREAPRQLIEGPVEISPEELRLRYYTLRAEGNEPTAVCIYQTSYFI
jgi:nucleoporin NUP42